MSTATTEERSWTVQWVDDNRQRWKSQGRGKPPVREVLEPMSEIGCKVAEILASVYGGIYNAPLNVAKVDWTHPHFVKVCVDGYLATFDNDRLTRLVILCHEAAIRLEIEGASPRCMRLRFHQRKRWESGQSMWEGHPTIEQAVERVRKTDAQ